MALRRLKLALDHAMRRLAEGWGLLAQDIPHALPVLRDLLLAAWHDRAALERQRVRQELYRKRVEEQDERPTAVPPALEKPTESTWDEGRKTPVQPVDDIDRSK